MRKHPALMGRCATALAVIAAFALPFEAAQAKSDAKNVELLVGPPVTDIFSPYEGVQQCVRDNLTPEQRKITFTVLSATDDAAKANYVAESGTGPYSPPRFENMLYSSLGALGVQTTDLSPLQRNMIDWSSQKFAAYNDNYRQREREGKLRDGEEPISFNIKFADVGVTAAITTFDVNFSSGGFGIKIAGIGGGRAKSRINVRMDARLTEMAGGDHVDGTKATAGLNTEFVRISKQIIGVENGAGATSFFGSGNSTTLVDIDLGTKKNEAIQFMEGLMADGLAARLVIQAFSLHQCQPLLEYGDHLYPQAQALVKTK